MCVESTSTSSSDPPSMATARPLTRDFSSFHFFFSCWTGALSQPHHSFHSHRWLNDNRRELIENEYDPLNILFDDMPQVKTCSPGDLSEFQLTLENRFLP